MDYGGAADCELFKICPLLEQVAQSWKSEFHLRRISKSATLKLEEVLDCEVTAIFPTFKPHHQGDKTKELALFELAHYPWTMRQANSV
jgi:hypothetical protein